MFNIEQVREDVNMKMVKLLLLIKKVIISDVAKRTKDSGYSDSDGNPTSVVSFVERSIVK
jgi:hypothetical protein